ncbi:unnamed protein product [Parnassius mnemosyne]|uniref:Peptidase S1 domain-containing protein n=1 Tax=Parnassius mnemosyne TaxID=213953 RepID=A0AAV1KI56_9NEOP
MKAFLGIVVLILAVSSTHAQINSVEETTIYGYHRRIGIPEAARIKRLEEEIIRSGNLGRIVGGSATDISQVPYQAGLIMAFAEGNSICGGSLISNTRVVTAAHCYSESDMVAKSFTVVLGSNFIFYGGVRITTTNVAVHPNWDPWSTVNDVAVLRISRVSFSNVIQPINLPSGTDISNNFSGATALASGFGYIGEGMIRFI